MLQNDVQEADSRGRKVEDLYTEVAKDLIRIYGYTFEQIDKVTLPEYELLMETAALMSIDKADELHQQAWLTVAAGATRKDGKMVYTKYPKFFDKEQEIETLQEKQKKRPDKFGRLKKHLKDKDNGN